MHEQTFNKAAIIGKTDYELCIFNNCPLGGADLSGARFIDCVFNSCDLSLAVVTEAIFQEVVFKDCKMLGFRLDTCNVFGLSVAFDNCVLDHASFYKLKLKKVNFKNSRLGEADFTETDLTGALFENCDLAGAVFDHTMLEQADLRSAYNYSIDPENNRVKNAKFSISGIAGLLDKYGINIDK